MGKRSETPARVFPRKDYLSVAREAPPARDGSDPKIAVFERKMQNATIDERETLGITIKYEKDEFSFNARRRTADR